MRISLLPLCLLAASLWGQQASLVATYRFQNSLAASQSGVPALTAQDPLGQNAFLTDTVLGQPRTVYQLASRNPTANAGFSFNSTNLLNPTTYSVELLFTFTEGQGTRRRLIDVLDRTTDRGIYANPNNQIEFAALNARTTTTLTTGTYVHFVMTVADNRARVYINGTEEINLSTNSMNFVTPSRVMSFFLDNTEDSSRTDFASARVALFRAYTNVLSAAEARTLATDPFNATVGIGAPSFVSSDVRNGATFSASTPIAPGAFFSILGSSLSDGTGDWSGQFSGSTAPTTLNGTRVLINNTPAFLSFTSPGQLNAIAPDTLTPGPVSIVVERNGVRSTTVTAQARAVNPSFFTYDQRNRRFIATLAADNSAYIAPRDLFGVSTINGLAVRPARPGEFIVAYGMGLGPTNPNVPAGNVPAPREAGYPVSGTVILRLGNRTISPLYTGLSSFAGVYVVGFQVPADQGEGDWELQITINGTASPTGVVIPIAR